MLSSDYFKYVAAPPSLAYMPLTLVGMSVGGFVVIGFLGLALNWSTLPALIVLIVGFAVSLMIGLKEPHFDSIIRARGPWLRATPNILSHKGKFYVG